MWYKEIAGDFVLHKWHSCIEFFAQERAYWFDSTIITFIGGISSKLISFCIKQEDRRLSLEQQSHKDESLSAWFLFFPGFGWIDVPGFFHEIFGSTHRTVDLLFQFGWL